MAWVALVLAGGGVAGIAWETGLLLGLADAAPQIADRLAVKTIRASPGSTAAAQLASGTPLRTLFESPVRSRRSPLTLYLQLFGVMMADAVAGATAAEEAQRRTDAIVLSAETNDAVARRAVVEARLPSHERPERPLVLTAVDMPTGVLCVFGPRRCRSPGRSRGELRRAGIWPSSRSAGCRMDGGMRSPSNADAAAGAERVPILIPGLFHHRSQPCRSALGLTACPLESSSTPGPGVRAALACF